MPRKFLGYVRPDGRAGIRNEVLIIAVTRAVHILAAKIAQQVKGTKAFVTCDEDGKTTRDRDTLARVFVGLGCNANVASVLLVCNKTGAGYAQLLPEVIAEAIKKTGKVVKILSVEEEGGFYQALGEGIKMTRELVWEASALIRRPVDIGNLVIGVKCGLSDATSGISGNPVVGHLVDHLIDAGATVIFSETTEVIGAEEVLAARCSCESVKQEFLAAVYQTEAAAAATGEDIRSINPIPANIAAGITTLEEKSLGAMAKTGHRPIRGVLRYAEQPQAYAERSRNLQTAKKGLYFMDAWMSSTSLFLGYAAAGASLVIFQMGGADLPVNPPMPAVATGLIAPIFYTTGNPYTYKKAAGDLDFNAGMVIDQKEALGSAGERLVEAIRKVACGRLTKAETYLYQDAMEVYLQGPNL